MIALNLKSTTIFTMLLAFASSIFAQDNPTDYTPIKFPEKISENYFSKRKQEYLDLISQVPPSGISKEDYEKFAQLVVYGKAEMFISGEVYIGWNELETYLNDILQKLLPSSLKGKNNIHIYPTNDPDFNASALHDGTIFFNIGMLADAENEAAIAAIIGHELSHYYYNDLQTSFINKVKASKDKENNKKSKTITFKLVHEDREREEVADTFGFNVALKAGYDIREAIHNFYTFLDEEQIAEHKNRYASISNVYIEKTSDGKIEEKSLSDLLASHPETNKRIEMLNKYCKKNISNKDVLQKYQVRDEGYFKKIRQQARYESLYHLLEEINYSDCAEKAFLYFLFNPENDYYLYYILESLRRGMYLDRTLKNQGFLSEEYSEYFAGEPYNILKKPNLLIRDQAKLSKIKAEDFKDTTTIPFVTYQQAFQYFSNLCIKRNIKEAFLSIALASKSPSKRDSLLTTYLSFNKVNFREFASALKKGTLYSNNFSKQLILSDGVNFYCVNKYGQSLDLVRTEEKNEEFFENLNYLKKKTNDLEILQTSQVMEKSFSDAIDLRNSINSAAVIAFYKQKPNMRYEELDLYIFNPYYYNLLNKFQLKSLSFLIAKNYNLGYAIKGSPLAMYEFTNIIYRPTTKEKLFYYQITNAGKLNQSKFAYHVQKSLANK